MKGASANGCESNGPSHCNAFQSDSAQNRQPGRNPGLTPVQDGVLHFILGRCREQDLFQKHVEEEFNLRRSTATELLKLMEKKGLIYREGVSYDARLKKIMPTDKGVMLEGQVLKDILEMERLVTKGIPEEELEAFLATGTKMMNNLK